MNEDQMLERCPTSRLLGKAVLHNHKLEFTIYSPKRKCGCADIIYSENDSVYGLIYLLNETDISALDTFEGSPNYYKRITLEVFHKGELLPVHTYDVVNKESNLAPSLHYIGLIKDAALKFDFPLEYRLHLDSIKTVR